MLEENESVYSNRDSHFREMVKGFQETKRDLAEQIIGNAGGELGRMDKEELLALLDGK